ncbi:MAG TPA: hypothetical protein VMW52_10595 [Phycisphaerae bacterium]|nr:hypothetical protein [Phycisphaerae bacterium]
MIVNATLTGWRKRTGSSEAGVATFAEQSLARPVQALRAGLTTAQEQLLAANELTADESVIHKTGRTGAPDIGAGDRVQLDGAAVWHEVVRVGQTIKGPLSARLLFVRRLT